jgi:hypothetical protein
MLTRRGEPAPDSRAARARASRLDSVVRTRERGSIARGNRRLTWAGVGTRRLLASVILRLRRAGQIAIYQSTPIRRRPPSRRARGQPQEDGSRLCRQQPQQQQARARKRPGIRAGHSLTQPFFDLPCLLILPVRWHAQACRPTLRGQRRQRLRLSTLPGLPR